MIKRGAIIHTDRGSQYASVEYRRLLYIDGIRQSTSGKGALLFQAAQAESFFSRFRAELVALSKIGNARLRKALYFPAITALRCSSFFKAWADGLRTRGKCKMAVIGAVMRKLIHLAYGVLKTGKPFDPNWAKIA